MNPQVITEQSVLAIPAVKALWAQAETWQAIAESYVVNSPEMAEAANSDLGEIKALHKTVESMRKEMKQPHADAAKAVDDAFRKPLEFLKRAEEVQKDAIQKYLNEQERIRLEAERAARAQAEAERRRIEAERAAEARAAAEKARAERERIEAERRAALAAAEASGQIEEAQFVEDPTETARLAELEAQAKAAAEAAQEPVFIPEVLPAEAEPVALSGISQRTTYEAEVVDLLELVKAVASGQIQPEVLLPNTKVLNGLAKTMKDALRIPGVKAVPVRTMSKRTK